VGNTFGDRLFFSGVTLEVWLKQLPPERPRIRPNILRRTHILRNHPRSGAKAQGLDSFMNIARKPEFNI
jgi:hypothetical protein